MDHTTGTHTNSTADALTEFFGPPIDVVTRADLIECGDLIEVPATAARQGGFTAPVALTRGAWASVVAWSEDDSERTGMLLDEDSRLRAALWMASGALQAAITASGGKLPELPLSTGFCVQVIDADGPGDGDGGITPRTADMRVVIGPDDQGDPCITIMLPGES